MKTKLNGWPQNFKSSDLDILFSEKTMRKNIDIPDEIVKDLKQMAIDADTDLKNYIQDLLVQHVKKHKKK